MCAGGQWGPRRPPQSSRFWPRGVAQAPEAVQGSARLARSLGLCSSRLGTADAPLGLAWCWGGLGKSPGGGLRPPCGTSGSCWGSGGVSVPPRCPLLPGERGAVPCHAVPSCAPPGWQLAEGTQEPAPRVTSCLCSGDITRGCHGSGSRGDGVIGKGQGGCGGAPGARRAQCPASPPTPVLP